MIRGIFIISVFLVFIPPVKAQVNGISFGLATGIGDINSGKSPSLTSFGLSGYMEISPDFWNAVDFRIGYSYMRKIEILLPENSTGRYYPFLQAIKINVIMRQLLSNKFFLEEGIGPVLINDRIFSDINEWDAGISGWFALGIDLQKFSTIPFTISFGSEFGLTVTNTTASYIIYYLQAQYFLLN